MQPDELKQAIHNIKMWQRGMNVLRTNRCFFFVPWVFTTGAFKMPAFQVDENVSISRHGIMANLLLRVIDSQASTVGLLPWPGEN
jgi:hypothetical protein